ncbi:hypothetical protein AHAS_Ahas03G0012700 [Arachis hypogaea]
MFTLFPNAFTFSGSLSGSFPATVCTGFAKESKLLLATNSGSMWNCTSSIFCFSSNEFRNPAFRFENASSSGARIVMPPVLAVMSCELMLFIISVVFIRRIRTLKIFAFFRIFVMSSGAASDESEIDTLFEELCCVMIGMSVLDCWRSVGKGNGNAQRKP